MSDYTRRGVAGLCIAAVLALVGIALRAIGSPLTSDLSGVLFISAGIAAVASLLAVARGVSSESSDQTK